MNSERINNLKKHLQIIVNITLKAQEAFLIVDYLSKDEEDLDVNYEKRMNTFFYYARVSYWQITVIELSKLFLKREKYSIIKLLDKLKKDGEYSEMNIPELMLNNWYSNINNEEEIIKNLQLQRDKIYAHEDGSSEEIDNKVSLDKIKVLLEIPYEMIRKLDDLLGSVYRMFDLINSPATSLKYNIERLANEKKITIENYRGLAIKYNLEEELPKTNEKE